MGGHSDPDAGEGRARSIGQRTMGGMGWMSVSVVLRSILQLVVLGILARHITPREFGVVSAALVVLASMAVFAEAGVGTALVQRPTIDDRDIRVAFTFQVVAAIVLWLVLWSAADLIAAGFDIDGLTRVLPVITFAVVLDSLSLGAFLLQREMRFRQLAIVEVVSWAVGYGLVTVVLALLDFGLWALVLGNVTQLALRTTLLWVLRPHPARPLWDLGILRGLLFFGGGYTLGWWANFVARQGDNVVVGRWLGAEQLGLYTRAYSLMRQPATLFGQVVNKVLFPAMAAVQHDRRRLRSSYLRAAAVVAIVVLPFSAVAMVLSPEIITVVLGPEWLALRPAFDVMVYGMLFRTSYKLGDSLATATGHVYQRAARQILYAVVVIGGALVGQRWGIVGVAWALLVALGVNFGAMAGLSLRLTGASWYDYAAVHLPGAILGVASGIAAAAVALPLRGSAPDLVVLLAGGGAAAAVVLALIRFAPAIPFAAGLAAEVTAVRRLAGAGARGRFDRGLGRVLGRRYASRGSTDRGDVVDEVVG